MDRSMFSLFELIVHKSYHVFALYKINLQEVLIEPIAHDSGGLVWTLLAAIEEEADLRYFTLH